MIQLGHIIYRQSVLFRAAHDFCYYVIEKGKHEKRFPKVLKLHEREGNKPLRDFTQEAAVVSLSHYGLHFLLKIICSITTENTFTIPILDIRL